MTFYNWLTNSQQCKSREELGTKPPHNCLVGCSYLARGGKNQISSLQTRLHSLPSFSQIMQEYWQPGRTGMPTETHGIARSAVVPCSLTTFHGDKVSYIFNLPCPFCLLKKINLYSDFLLLASPDVSLLRKVVSVHAKALCRCASFCMPNICFMPALKLNAHRHRSYIHWIRTGVWKGQLNTNCELEILSPALCR